MSLGRDVGRERERSWLRGCALGGSGKSASRSLKRDGCRSRPACLITRETKGSAARDGWTGPRPPGIIEFPRLTNPSDEAPVMSIDQARTDVQQAIRALMTIADSAVPTT